MPSDTPCTYRRFTPSAVERNATVMRAGLRGFDRFAASLPAERAFRLVEEMSGPIVDRGGTLLSYAGGVVTAVFGAPDAQPDHADRALTAACEMLARVNAELRDAAVGIGIGVSSGKIVYGAVGSPQRYAVIGEAMKMAGELEELTEQLSHPLLIDESTQQRLRAEAGEPALVAAGRERRLRLWTLAPATRGRGRRSTLSGPLAQAAPPLRPS